MRYRLNIYKTSAGLSLGITFIIHTFYFLVGVWHTALQTPYRILPKPEGLNGWVLLFSFLLIFVFLFLEFVIVFRLIRSRRRYKKLKLLLGLTLLTALYCWFEAYIYVSLFEKGPLELSKFYFGTLVINAFLTFIVILISYIDYIQKKHEKTALENEALKAQNIQSRYEALKNQMDPHFLFNTFSSLTSMIELDPAKAQEFSLKMSSVLRYTLQNKDTVSLAEEIEFVRDYCSLMQIRYHESLKITFDIEETYNSFSVIPLSIQTLIENAVKHNEISRKYPLNLMIFTGDRTVTVSNNINKKRDKAVGMGLGLANLSERYMLKWQHEIRIHKGDDTFEVTLPLIKK